MESEQEAEEGKEGRLKLAATAGEAAREQPEGEPRTPAAWELSEEEERRPAQVLKSFILAKWAPIKGLWESPEFEASPNDSHYEYVSKHGCGEK